MQFKLEQKVKVAVTYKLADSVIEILEARDWKRPMLLCSTFQLRHPLIEEMM